MGRSVCEGGGGGGGAYAASQTTVLHMKRLNQSECPILVILCVIYFQWQSFFTFIFSPSYCLDLTFKGGIRFPLQNWGIISQSIKL